MIAAQRGAVSGAVVKAAVVAVLLTSAVLGAAYALGGWRFVLALLAAVVGVPVAGIAFMALSASLGSVIDRVFRTGSKMGELIASLLIIGACALAAIPAWREYSDRQQAKARLPAATPAGSAQPR